MSRPGTIVTDMTLDHELPMSSHLTVSERALARSEPRLRIVQGDVYARLSHPPERTYDVVLIDLDHSPDEHLGGANASFYTEAGLSRARRHLSEGGILGVWSYAEHSPVATALREVFAEVQVEPVTVVNDLVGEEQTDWLFFARDPSQT